MDSWIASFVRRAGDARDDGTRNTNDKMASTLTKHCKVFSLFVHVQQLSALECNRAVWLQVEGMAWLQVNGG